MKCADGCVLCLQNVRSGCGGSASRLGSESSSRCVGYAGPGEVWWGEDEKGQEWAGRQADVKGTGGESAQGLKGSNEAASGHGSERHLSLA